MFRVVTSTCIGLLFFLSSSFTTHAQSIPGVTEPVTFQTSPSYPKPQSTVTVRAVSNNTDLNRATFTWYVNGKVFKRGTGITEISAETGAAGSTLTVSVEVDTIDIGTLTKETSFKPADVTLVWQSDGYTPPFYKGKALELYGSGFRVVAIPEFFVGGKRVDPKTVIYTWKKNGTADGSQSGYGKNVLISSQSSYVRGGDTITVEASTVDGTLRASKSITISPQTVDIVFYEDSPLYGVLYEKALKQSYTLATEELTLRAEPYSLSTKDLTSNLVPINWSINGQTVENFKNKQSITLRTTNSQGGRSVIGFDVSHTERILQGGNASITLFQ